MAERITPLFADIAQQERIEERNQRFAQRREERETFVGRVKQDITDHWDRWAFSASSVFVGSVAGYNNSDFLQDVLAKLNSNNAAEAQQAVTCDNLNLRFTTLEVNQTSQYPGKAELTVDTDNNAGRDAQLTFDGANGDHYTATDRSADTNNIKVNPPHLQNPYDMHVQAQVTLEDGTTCPPIEDHRTIDALTQPTVAPTPVPPIETPVPPTPDPPTPVPPTPTEKPNPTDKPTQTPMDCVSTDLDIKLNYTGNHQSGDPVTGTATNKCTNPNDPDNPSKAYIKIFGSPLDTEVNGWLESQEGHLVVDDVKDVPPGTTVNLSIPVPDETYDFETYQVDVTRQDTGNSPRIAGDAMGDYVFVPDAIDPTETPTNTPTRVPPSPTATRVPNTATPTKTPTEIPATATPTKKPTSETAGRQVDQTATPTKTATPSPVATDTRTAIATQTKTPATVQQRMPGTGGVDTTAHGTKSTEGVKQKDTEPDYTATYLILAAAGASALGLYLKTRPQKSNTP